MNGLEFTNETSVDVKKKRKKKRYGAKRYKKNVRERIG